MSFLAFTVGAVLGGSLASWLTMAWAMHCLERRFKRYKEAPVELRVTPELADQFVEKIIEQWLTRRGMTIVPRGKEFKWPGEVRS